MLLLILIRIIIKKIIVYTRSWNSCRTSLVYLRYQLFSNSYVLIKAFAEVEKNNNCHLTIMGDGSQLNTLKGMANELGVADKITFYGRYKRNEFAEKLKESDAFVLVSRDETFGIVYVEAMAAGLPVIASRCGGPEDFVNEDNGLLVDIEDIDGLAVAMQTMIDTIGNYDRKKISQYCKEHFSAEEISKQIKEVIGGVL